MNARRPIGLIILGAGEMLADLGAFIAGVGRVRKPAAAHEVAFQSNGAIDDALSCSDAGRARRVPRPKRG